jgi:hypothetical protein
MLFGVLRGVTSAPETWLITMRYFAIDVVNTKPRKRNQNSGWSRNRQSGIIVLFSFSNNPRRHAIWREFPCILHPIIA